MSKQSFTVCCFFKRKFKLKEAEIPAEIKDLFEKYSENGYMNVEHLHKFLKEVQGECNVTKEEAESVMDFIIRDLHHLMIFHRKHLNLDVFFRYLFNVANSPLLDKVHHDMTAPLSHYFIYTSHNTYLTGNQLSSDCSDVPIVEALHRGVRVIELDMWPNSNKDNVDILHGRTLTSPVELIKCLKSIKQHAFIASEYPVIITLEDHLDRNLQAKVAEMVTQEFEDVLFTNGTRCFSEFPSPESLKRKIIISTKPPKEYLESKSFKDKEKSDKQVKKSSEEMVWGKEVSNISDKLKIISESAAENAKYQDEEDSQSESNNSQQDSGSEYKHLIAIQARKLRGPPEEWLRTDPEKAQRVSLNEEKFEKTIVSHGTEMIRFTQKNLVRVYPKATRFDSSNYNPIIGWMHGVQMVAFNMQGYDRYLWLMQGLFRANGGLGYVKKPDILLKSDSENVIFDPKKSSSVKKVLKVKVYMGEGWNLDFDSTHFDAYSPPDFYVKIGIAGVPADSIVKKTRIIEDNWLPHWDEEFEFRLTVPELALLRIEVHEYDVSEKDDFGGQTCLLVSEVRSGIRAVPLHDKKGEKYNSVKLLMRFDFVEPDTNAVL